MDLIFSENAWEDYLYWQKTDKKTLRRINTLLKDIQKNKYQGIGKPEPLKHALTGWWSRRINDQDRIVYKVKDKQIEVAQLKYHY